jgi:hypothetical protein
VVRYRSLHDTSFSEAKEYHLELDWVLCKEKAGK